MLMKKQSNVVSDDKMFGTDTFLWRWDFKKVVGVKIWNIGNYKDDLQYIKHTYTKPD
jgi:hypothetical protein